LQTSVDRIYRTVARCINML